MRMPQKRHQLGQKDLGHVLTYKPTHFTDGLSIRVQVSKLLLYQ